MPQYLFVLVTPLLYQTLVDCKRQITVSIYLFEGGGKGRAMQYGNRRMSVIRTSVWD